jgi:hypothetical protein
MIDASDDDDQPLCMIGKRRQNAHTIPVNAEKFPVIRNNFPDNLRREFGKKPLRHRCLLHGDWP